jgi:hypothetical protein
MSYDCSMKQSIEEEEEVSFTVTVISCQLEHKYVHFRIRYLVSGFCYPYLDLGATSGDSSTPL